jgi:hypothetical protein
MDGSTIQALLMEIILWPFAIFCWVMLFADVGIFSQESDQPSWFRHIVEWLRNATDRFSIGGLEVDVLGLAFFNSVPVAFLVFHPYPIITLLLELSGFVFQGMMIYSLTRAALKVRARDSKNRRRP